MENYVEQFRKNISAQLRNQIVEFVIEVLSSSEIEKLDQINTEIIDTLKAMINGGENA